MEELLNGGDTVKFGIPGVQDLLMLINHQNQGTYQNIRSIYWTVSTVAVGSILDRIMTTLAELVAEMRAGMPADGEVPSPELANQAVQIAVHGKGSRITLNNAQSSTGTITQTTHHRRKTARHGSDGVLIGGFIVGAATVIGVAVQIFGG